MDALAELSPSAMTLPRLTEGEVQRRNALFGTHREFSFVWLGKPAALRFVETAQAIVPARWLRARLGDQGFELGLLETPEPAAMGAAFAGIEVRLLPEELLLGVLETWLQDPINRLAQLGLGFELCAWRDPAENDEPIPPAACGWEIAWAGQPLFLRGTLHASPEAVTQLANLVQRLAPQPGRPAAEVAFPVSVALGRVALPLATTGTLGAGDVVWLPLTQDERAQGTCELWTADRLLGHARREGKTVTLLTMHSSPPPPAAPAVGTAQIDDLPVNVVFDLGQVEFTVGQLRTLNAGYTFELPAMPDRLVNIRVNGREVGQGELVEIGDRVGVRIVTWSLT